MSKEHRKAADQALVMDAPRILRKDMTLLTELLAKYQGMEGALNAVGQEEAANEVSDLVVPLVNARQALEHVIDALNQANAPALPGISSGDSEAAAQAAFDMEDALMGFINEHNRLPKSVVIRPDVHALLATVWPGRTEVKLPKGAVAIHCGLDAQGPAFSFVG